jgi:hypothetical protein
MQNELEERVARLETKLSRARALNRAGILALGVFLVAAAASPDVQESIRARKLEIVDASGRTVIELRSDEAGGRIALFGPRDTIASGPVNTPRRILLESVIDATDPMNPRVLQDLKVTPQQEPSPEPQILIECGPEAGQVRIKNSRGNDAVLSPFPRLIPL